ncbi:MAG: c-type cytochrome [Planctomycetota bacterium]|nr:c-type cytochrome [Planctomycetota bacterium]
MKRLIVGFALIGFFAVPGFAQEHSHGEQATASPKVSAPKVFLDKSPRIVAYQLKRLDNQRLLMVERRTTDLKFVPVYAAILSRVGMSPQFRDEAVKALVKLQESNDVEVLLEAIGELDVADRDQERAARQLAGMLLRLPVPLLKEQSDSLQAELESDEELRRVIGAAGLITAGEKNAVFARLAREPEVQRVMLAAIPLLPTVQLRDSLRDDVLAVLERSKSKRVVRAAITALRFIPTDGADTFRRLAIYVSDDGLRDAAVKTLLTISSDQRSPEICEQLVNVLVEYAEAIPPANRTSDNFIDAMQLVDQLMARLPSGMARQFRDRLSEITVRVIRIRTVEEEMRYDVPYFAVEAGKSVQVILENHDLMPHNLVITTPDSLKEVAMLGLQVGPDKGWNGLPYVPESAKVLHASEMVAPDQQARLTFTAPPQPGEYPYVCTFPQHWYRMYGVMVVVEDLDGWLKDPVEPANPIGSNRSFVQAWTVDDLKSDLDSQLRGRSLDIGKRLFAEASCAGCHKMAGEGGVIGPELTGLLERWKGDKVGVLREVLEPSHKVDAKYVMQRILTVDGRTVTGVLVEENDDVVKLLTNPESKEPTVVLQDDIEAMVPSSVSMMPKALMDQYTKDEIFELLAYLLKE